MDTLQDAGEIFDIDGQPDSNVGNMFSRIKTSMADVAEAENHAVRITDILAVDTLAPVEISGALAGETCMEKAVGIAAMVKTAHLPMHREPDFRLLSLIWEAALQMPQFWKQTEESAPRIRQVPVSW